MYEKQRRSKLFFMKRYFMLAAAAFLLTGYATTAQDAKTIPGNDSKKEQGRDKKDKLGEYDEIVIKRKNDDKDAKVTVEIKGDEVLIDGKPIDDFANDEVSVKIRGANRFRLNTPGSPFRMEDGWTFDGLDMADNDGNVAFLGVTTEGSSSGARITGVSENSAAAKAGLKKDDIITKVNDKAVFDQDDLSEQIRSYKPDDKITITYKRGDKESKTTAILGKRNMMMGRAPMPPRAPGAPMPPMVFNFDENGDLGEMFQNHAKPRLGLKVQDTEDEKGVKVLDVDENSPAAKAGIKENDIITSFEGKQVTSAGDLAKASREAKEKSTLKVQLNRNGKTQTVDIKVPKKLKTANL